MKFTEKKNDLGQNVQKKPTRTISGVAPLAVMIPPRKCDHGACLYCPSFGNSPQSYTPESPAVLRALSLGYDPKKQVETRLGALNGMHHPTDKIELIIMGGTFLAFPKEFQFDFVKKCYDALNGCDSKTLEEAKKINETSKHRCVALCIETRPDFCSDFQIKDMLEWGTTRVEIGVQILDDKIYKEINRGHTVKDVVDATVRLKRAGFKLGYHIMPGLPGSNPKKDFAVYKKIFSDSKFKPDQVKIYPCQVLKNSGLEKMYYNRKFVPYDEKTVSDLIVKMMKVTPRYVRVMRIMREIPKNYLVAGVIKLDLRKDVEEKIREDKIKVNEIRFREIGFAMRDLEHARVSGLQSRKINHDLKIKKTVYSASGGKEIFIECVNKDDLLFGLLRLRLEAKKNVPALVRELHVYGPALNLGEEGIISQHKGIGKQLMAEAEKISKKLGYKQIRVISGVGVREYYKVLGYKIDKEGIYMEKGL
jgi:elongator complex protein 3